MALVRVYPKKSKIEALDDNDDKIMNKNGTVKMLTKVDAYYLNENLTGKTVKSVASAGGGIYYDRSQMSKAEKAEHKLQSFERLIPRRMNKLVKVFNQLTACTSSQYKWDVGHADKIIATVDSLRNELANKLYNVKDDDDDDSGFTF